MAFTLGYINMPLATIAESFQVTKEESKLLFAAPKHLASQT